MDKLYSALQKVQDKDVLIPTLSKLLEFLSALGNDANFKISLSTMQILADLALKLGSDIRPYLGYGIQIPAMPILSMYHSYMLH